MMLSNFIRRNGKRKGGHGKTNGPHSHYKSFSTSESSQLPSPLVFDINEESRAVQSSPVVELRLSTSNEEWFPRELLRSSRSCSPSSFRRSNNAVETESTSAEVTRTSSSPVPSLSYSETASPSISSRKKSIPAPIMIPDHVVPNIQIGQSAIPSAESQPSQPNANRAWVNPPSPSVSENLSSISGTTLARALIASSFVLSSTEHRGSRHRSGVARQDSATLPRGSFFLSDSGSVSHIPPVPPVPAGLVGMSPDPSHPPTLRSGASTESEYPLSDAYITSPETTNHSAIPRSRSRVQEIPSPTVPVLTEAPPATVPATKWKRRVGPFPARSRTSSSGLFDGPERAAEADSQGTQSSLQEQSVLLSFDDHSLDEFDFLQPGPMVMVASPKSDSSASCVAPSTPPPKRGDAPRGQWKRGAAGLNLIRNGSKVSLSNGTFASQQVHGTPLTSASEHDYGELLNYDLTVSPGSSMSSSSASAGYQTFPETPMVFSPLWSSGYAFLARSDSQVPRRRLPSVKSAGRGLGRSHSKATKRHAVNDDGSAVVGRSQSPSFPKQKTPSPNQSESNPPSSVPVDGSAGEGNTTNEVQTRHPEKPLPSVRPHPLAHVSSSSSYVLEEEALQALAKHSPSSLPSITVDDVDHPLDPTAILPSVMDLPAKSPTSTPLPESTDVSPYNSPELGNSSAAVSSPESPLQMSLFAMNATISQPSPLKHLLSPPSPSLVGSSFLPSASSSPTLDRPFPSTHSPVATARSTVVPDDLISHSPSPSFIPPPSYHDVVSGGAAHLSSFISTPALSRMSSTGPVHRSRQPSNSSLSSGTIRTRVRPPLPLGPRKPSGPGQSAKSLFPGIHGRNGSTSSVGSDSAGGLGFSWRKLHSAASKPPPKFQVPPPKWRGLTLEAAQWTFTSAQLQEIVSQAIRQSSEGSALRFFRPDILDGEIADEMQRLELQHLDVKAQYKSLVHKRWILMGALAGHIEGIETSNATAAAGTVEELAEVSSTLDGLADKVHDVVLQMAQLKSLRDVHNTSALAMAVRKINALFVRQMAEREQLQEQVDALRTERDEAWKHAEEAAQDYDALNDRTAESACGCGDAKMPNTEVSSSTSSKRSMRISAVRKSSLRLSQAGLRSRSRHRSGRLSRPASLLLDDDIPPVPRLPANPPMGSSGLALSSGMSYSSAYGSTPGTSAALALVEAQREVYEMLGLSVPPSQASSRRRTISGSAVSRPPTPISRPASESLDGRMRGIRRVRSRQEWGSATKSVILGDSFYVRPLTISRN